MPHSLMDAVEPSQPQTKPKLGSSEAGKLGAAASLKKRHELAAFTTKLLEQHDQIRLVRVRLLLDRIDKMLESELDPIRIDKLAGAVQKLAEQERVLAGRPLPGSRRPRAERAERQIRDLPECE